MAENRGQPLGILTRHILGEILKVLILTCVVIATVIAFGAAIRPLAQELLGPTDLFRYIGLATVPMLQFALPFSAGFAATIVLHRMTVDNEVMAMSVAGIPYRRVMRPVALLGLGLVLVMFALVSEVVPRFRTMLGQMLARDVTRIFVSTIEDGRAFVMGNLQIYADEAIVVEPPPGAITRLLLSGVAAVQLDDHGQPDTEFTAEAATVDMYRNEGGVFLKPALARATIFRAIDGTLAYVPRAFPDAVRVLPPAYEVPKFMGLERLFAVWRNPDLYMPAIDRRLELEQVLAEAAAWKRIAEDLASDGALEFDDAIGRRTYVVEAGSLSGTDLLPPPGAKVIATERERGAAQRQATTASAALVLRFDESDGRPRFDLVLREPETVALSTRPEFGGRWPARLSGLRLRGPDADRPVIDDARIAPQVAALETNPGPAALLHQRGRDALAGLEHERHAVTYGVHAEVSQRVALSLSALLLTALGAVLAVWLREAVPLTVYVLAFLPAIANILFVAGGARLIRDGSTAFGLALLWSGDAILAAVLVSAWSRMSKH